MWCICCFLSSSTPQAETWNSSEMPKNPELNSDSEFLLPPGLPALTEGRALRQITRSPPRKGGVPHPTSQRKGPRRE